MAGPTGGYLAGFVLAAAAMGWLAERGWDRTRLRAVVALSAGLAMIYLGGFAWLTQFAPAYSAAFAQGIAPFIVADLVKVAIAAVALPQAWRPLRD